MVVVLMGVSGAGKTTIGQLLARDLGWGFYDADDLHTPANKQKMAAGVALTDTDRMPWLKAIRELIARLLAENRDAVIACSALKTTYREEIAAGLSRLKFVYLKGTFDLIAARVAARVGHFMNKVLLRSQFDTLEEPRDAIVVDVSRTPAEIVAQIRAALGI